MTDRCTNRFFGVAMLWILMGSGMVGPVFAETSSDTLQGPIWQWVSFTSPVEEVKVDAPEKYTIQILDDERFAVRADCNRGVGKYVLGPDYRITLGSLALTRAMCPPGSLSEKFVAELSRATSFFFKDGELFMELPVDSGALNFRQVP
jgi:heat shock protein HslJ